MSRSVAVLGLAALFLGLVEILFPGWMVSILCWVMGGVGGFAVALLGALFWGALYTLPLGLTIFLFTAVRLPKDWEMQLAVGLVAWGLCVALWTVVQLPAHLFMAWWQLADIREDFRRNSGGVALHCKVDWNAIQRRNQELARWGYTMYGIWEVSGDTLYDEAGKPDSCGVDTHALYFFTWWPDEPPQVVGE